jgi:hypothetical protein
MALGAVFIVTGVLPWSDTETYWQGWSDRLLGIGVGAAFLVLAYRPRLELKQDVIIARGIIFSKRIPLIELVDARAGYYGITLSTRDGRTFTPTFVGEKANLSRLLAREIATTRDQGGQP